MGKLRMLWARVKGQAAQRREDDAFDDEIHEHITLLEKRFRAQGMSEREAARMARRQFGNVTLLKERHRAQRGILLPEEWWQDVHFGMRMMAKRPALNAAMVLALALGIGLNVAIFTFVNALLLRPPQGVSATNKLAEVWLHNPKGSGLTGYLPFNYPDYTYYRDHTKSLEGLFAFDGDGTEAIWNHEDTSEIVHGQLVSGNLFPLLGVNAVAGRTLTEDDDLLENPRQAAVVSYPFWKRKLGGDAGVVGRTLILDGEAFTVVGVSPAGFSGLIVGANPDFWAPLAIQEKFTHDKGRIANRDGHWLLVGGRMRSEVDLKEVQAEMHVLAKQAYLSNDSKDELLDASAYPMTLVPGPFRGYVGAFTALLQAVFILLLLIACTNAASLLLARATGRVQEMAIRSALGARRGRLMRQMLVESLLLAGVAGVAGLAIAWATSRLLLELKPPNIPITLAIPMDWRVVVFTTAVSVATGLIFGLAPAVRASAVGASRVLKEESQTAGRKKMRVRSALVVAQIATCAVLLTAATLCVHSLINANTIDPGFDVHHIAVATLDPASLGYPPEKRAAFYTRLLEQVQGLPGVTSASYANFLPLGTASEGSSVSKQLGKDPNEVPVHVFRVSPGFFKTMGITLLRGRDLPQSGTESLTPNVVVINETLAQRLWPGEDSVGKRLAMPGEKVMSEIVGVVKDGKYRTLGEAPMAVVFRGTLPPRRTLVVRTSGDSRTLLDPLSREIPTTDPMMVATQVQTIEDYMALPLFPARAMGWLLGISGILAVAMTAIGLFGLIAYLVSQRTHEIGVRIALGAQRSDVLKMIIRQGLGLTAIGLGIGLCAAAFLSRLLSQVLYGIRANDPATMVMVALGLAVIALSACYLPARKAMRVDPSEALRYE